MSGPGVPRPGIPLNALVLLGLGVTARRLGAGRAKRRTTSHPVSPVNTEAGGSGQKSSGDMRAKRVRRRYWMARRVPTALRGRRDDAVVVVAPRSASLAGLSRVRHPPLAGRQ